MKSPHDFGVHVGASPQHVWALLADITRMGEWSPECVRCRWIAPAKEARPGARFRGTSKNGWHRWSTTSTIVEAEAGRSLVFDVSYFTRPVARWAYRFEPDGNGTTVVESVEDRRGKGLRLVSPFVTGSRDRATRNTASMQTTLEHLKSAAEQ